MTFHRIGTFFMSAVQVLPPNLAALEALATSTRPHDRQHAGALRNHGAPRLGRYERGLSGYGFEARPRRCAQNAARGLYAGARARRATAARGPPARGAEPPVHCR